MQKRYKWIYYAKSWSEAIERNRSYLLIFFFFDEKNDEKNVVTFMIASIDMLRTYMQAVRITVDQLNAVRD